MLQKTKRYVLQFRSFHSGIRPESGARRGRFLLVVVVMVVVVVHFEYKAEQGVAFSRLSVYASSAQNEDDSCSAVLEKAFSTTRRLAPPHTAENPFGTCPDRFHTPQLYEGMTAITPAAAWSHVGPETA